MADLRACEELTQVTAAPYLMTRSSSAHGRTHLEVIDQMRILAECIRGLVANERRGDGIVTPDHHEALEELADMGLHPFSQFQPDRCHYDIGESSSTQGSLGCLLYGSSVQEDP